MKRNPFFQTPSSPFKIEYTRDDAIDALTHDLNKRMLAYRPFTEVVTLCIGTDRSTGDALGPLVGTRLQKLYPPGMQIYGTIDEPVHAVNLKENIEKIEKKHPYALVIAVDACLGQFNSVGNITISHGPLKPGAGVKKELPEVGNLHITGIVNIGGFMEYFVLQNTRLSIVMKMADTIAHSLYKSSYQLFHPKENLANVKL
ncbi:spore protease YyaC [Ammoniphilus sp. CFH 90114]|uniref:spore protease YyaC n=1 Tax=Ammoniphilus sp. CFH 90114 TaxID=2493665 RepID=UPI00100F1AB4|nr:spore protease YyaC [Ammoniphilus sp. CFH 90114]RXT08887.1 spore protease YyaC [Ammoniphilus sp. CFH 90114]